MVDGAGAQGRWWNEQARIGSQERKGSLAQQENGWIDIRFDGIFTHA